MTDDDVLAEFRAAGALLEGHFILSSGLRSSRYLQCARVLMDPRRAARLAAELVRRLPGEVKREVDAVVSPAMGGVIAGHEMARALGVEAMFLERPAGVFELRRGFRLHPGQRVLLMEDVVIHPDHRGQGYGAMLVDYVVDFAKRKNFKRITLLTDKMSAESQEFFRKHGFEHSHMIPMRRIID